MIKDKNECYLGEVVRRNANVTFSSVKVTSFKVLIESRHIIDHFGSNYQRLEEIFPTKS